MAPAQIDYERINKPEQIGSPDDGQVPGVHVGLWWKWGHFDKMAHQILQSPDEEERNIYRDLYEDTETDIITAYL